MAIFRGTGSAATSSDQTTIDTVTQAVVDAEAAQTAAETAQGLAETAKTNAENLYGDLAAVEAAKDTAVSSATTATTQAGLAATSAQSAADDASDANESFILTRGAFLDFQTLYLGVLASDPSVDNEGNPLEEGALYFNSTDDVMRTYDGSQWFTAFASLGGALVGTNNLSDVANAATSLTNLGLNATAAEINVLDVSAETPTDGQVLTYDTINGLNWETPATPTETNDLTASVTWANVPDANITQSSVTQHQAALTITESQISDLGSYLTSETNDLSSAVTWANVPDANITESSVTQHQAALSITESQISDFGTYEPVDTDILRADTADTLTAPMRGTITDNSASLTFDLTTTNNFKAAVSSGTPALTFTGMASASGQSGNIYINNIGATISAATSTVINSADLTTISNAGKYWLSYYCDGTDVYVTSSTALTDQGL